jgi:hypothetical protein
MLSRAERVRRFAELALRGVALAALGVLLWRAIRPPSPTGVDVAAGDLRSAVERWTYTPATEMRAVLDAAPDALTRDWLRALSRAGGTVRWSASRPIGAAAIATEPANEPSGATRLRLAAAAGEAVTIGDRAGLIDTLPRGGPAELELVTIAGDVHASGATFRAETAVRDSVVLRPVLVLGAAGWESKFTIAALEERGWRVASRARVAPGIEVTQGPLGGIDTSRYSAVILLDSTAAGVASDVARYARGGGGVVLAGSAARLTTIAAMAPGGVGRRVSGIAGAVASGAPRTGLGAFPVASPRPDAVVLESRDGAAIVAARRVDAGRVMQLGYDETWRWRMGGGDEAAAAHREWWSRIVAAVAYAPLVERPTATSSSIDETPLASLIDALGPATAFDGRIATGTDATRTTRLLFALVVGSLLLEWVSRRLRGAR